MLTTKKIFSFLVPCALCMAALVNNSCGIYKFKDISFPDTINTVKVNYFENRATYINPQLSPQLSDKLRQKIVSQTKLKQTNGENADWEISGTVTEYSFSTSGISNQQTTTNRINVTVHVILNNQKAGEIKEFDINRGFDFSSSQSLQQAESNLLGDMIKGLADDIFNRLFSTW